jgi:hypothetical protein
MGIQIVDNMRGIDVLSSLPFVKKDKIGATGASGGGNQTMYLSAFDERISAIMPVVSVGSFESYVYGMNCLCELLPDGLTITEEAGILALIAPRPLRIGNALYDCNHDFSVAEMLKTYHSVERLYWRLGKPENIAYSVVDRVHGMTDRQREAVLGHFDQFLKGAGTGTPLPEPDYELMTEEELRFFALPQSRPRKVRSIAVHCRIEGERLRNEFLAQKNFDSSQKRRQLANLLRMRPLSSKMQLHKYHEVDGIERYALEISDHLIPFLLKRGKKTNCFRIVLHPEGKNAITQAEIDILARGDETLIFPDLFGTGETAQPNHCIGLHHQFFRQLMWVGRSLCGEWCFDILALQKILKRKFKSESVAISGFLETGCCALFCNALARGIDSIEAIDAPVSLLFDMRSIQYVRNSPFDKFLPGGIYSIALSIPDFLKWGDISLVKALGYGKSVFSSPRSSDGTPLTQIEIKKFDTEVATLCNKITFQ